MARQLLVSGDGSIGLKRGVPLIPTEELRAQILPFIVIFPNQQGISVSQQKGSCGTCGMELVLRLDRIAAHIAGVPNRGISVCKKRPPAAAVAVAEKILEAQTAKLQKASKAREDVFLDQTLPDMAKRGTRDATDQAFALWVFGTGQSFNVGHHFLFERFKKALIADPSWKPEHRTTVSGTRLKAEVENVRNGLRAWISDETLKFGCTISSDGWTNAKVRTTI